MRDNLLACVDVCEGGEIDSVAIGGREVGDRVAIVAGREDERVGTYPPSQDVAAGLAGENVSIVIAGQVICQFIPEQTESSRSLHYAVFDIRWKRVAADNPDPLDI